MTPIRRGSRGRHRRERPVAVVAAPPSPRMEAALYECARPPRELSMEELGSVAPGPQQLVWVHLIAAGSEQLQRVAQALRLPSPAARFLDEPDGEPELRNFRTCFGVRVHEADFQSDMHCRAKPLVIVCGSNMIVSTSPEPLDCVEELRERQHQNAEVGALSAESFMVSLLDGQLSSYFDAMSRLEGEVERMEVEILADRQPECLDILRNLRQASSRLRRILAAHRNVFAGLARPDFQPNQAQQVNEHYAALDARYDRAMDIVEHGRDLVVGSFDLFTTRAAMSTNHTMQVLTFATVLLGVLAVVAGILGMNFDTPYFSAGVRGFWVAVGSMVAIAVASSIVARQRGWL
jgi:Mg2+ and Co2+ transporter CorA